jgi:hypothetical protein
MMMNEASAVLEMVTTHSLLTVTERALHNSFSLSSDVEW